MRVAVVEPVAEPQDLRPRGELRFRQRRDGAHAIGSQGSGASCCARRPAAPASSKLASGMSAVVTIATARPACAAPRSTSAIVACALSQPCAAVQPLSTNSTSGPAPATCAERPSSGSASATMISAAAIRRSSSSHSGVRAGVSSLSFSPSSSRSGGNTTRLGAGGVTRSSHQIAGSTMSAEQDPRRAEAQSARAMRPSAQRAAHLGIERDQRGLRRACRCGARDSSSRAAARARDRLAMRLEARAIGGTRRSRRGRAFRSAPRPAIRSACGRRRENPLPPDRRCARDARQCPIARSRRSAVSISASGERKSLNHTNCALRDDRRVRRQARRSRPRCSGSCAMRRNAARELAGAWPSP